ncbi:MAG: SAM-dependent methyltransferase, partial [Gorillibacterium sp.]|nr:SAM-dependent methyltransferase [Gorillibacterium sp.]
MEERQQTDLVGELRLLMKQAPEGCITFHDYMELCLYHPQFGYYCSDKQKIGVEGDFYTASDVGGIMAKVIGRYYASLVELNPTLVILAEWGGGTGKMAKTILDTVQEIYPTVYEKMTYEVIEKSPYHRKLQQLELKEHRAHVRFISEEQWMVMEPRQGVFILAQELL